MTYCSCAYTNCGLPYGHIQHCYYELIADEDAPKVIYCEDRGESDPPKTEYQATDQDVKDLSDILRDMNIFLINGYNVDENNPSFSCV